jgi:serine/threonine protein kinase
MTAKGAKAGRFKPKCPKCGKQFQLTVTGEAELSFASAPLEGEPRAAAKFDPTVTAPTDPGPAPARRPAALDATVAPEDGRSTAEAPPPPSPHRHAPAALDETFAEPGARPARASASLDATEAGEEPSGHSAADGDIPDKLGGYQVLKQLGRGGMGAVYLARQVSLDRPVALKVMSSEWASNPNFLVRFTREAYAAAQLVHHNVVQVHDIGEDRGVNYFSMEYVDGKSLGDLLKKGPIEPEAAAGYILQAARGLMFAHGRGMIHRDIKPDNLMINSHGVVKVADLGLVRTPGMEDPAPSADQAAHEEQALKQRSSGGRSLASLSGVTLAGQAMGTPAYMAPEQARDAAACDHRADIYSLGCTLFVLVTGKPVFTGENALEIMTAHASVPPPTPSAVNPAVPKALSDIILRMIAKKPEDRYQSMDEVVKVLEDFLGLQGADKQAATEQHLRTLEEAARGFHSVPLAAIRTWSLLGFFAGCAVLTLLLLFTSRWWVGGLFFLLGASTAAAYFVVRGSHEGTYLFRRVKEHLLGLTWVEWARVGGVTLMILLILYLLNLHWWFLLVALLGVGIAFGIHLGLDRPIAAQRAPHVEKVEHMLKMLRLRGLSEEALEEFVARFAGNDWEEFYEALFGYEKKLSARPRFGTGPKGPRPKFAAWRDSIVRTLDAWKKARQEARERAHLQAVEQKGLEAQGVAAAEAKARAEAVAQAIVEKAAEIKKQDALMDQTVAPEHARPLQAEDKQARGAPPRRVNLQDLYQVADAPRPPAKPSGPVLERLLRAAFGGGLRFTLGCCLLLISLFWMYSRGLLPNSVNAGDAETYANIWSMYLDQKPFAAAPIPEAVMWMLCSMGALAAGVVLITSALWGSWKLGVMTLLAAGVFLVSRVPDLIPAIGPLAGEVVGLSGGAVLTLAAFLFCRET